MADRQDQDTVPMRRIKLTTFGAFTISAWEAGRWVTVTHRELTARGSNTTFLKILASHGPFMDSYRRSLHPGEWERHEASRDVLIDALWPEEDQVPADPDNALSQAKSLLNRALRPAAGDDVVLLTDGSDKVGYALNQQVVFIDADDFERTVLLASETEGRGDRQQALTLWEQAYRLVQGDFLPHDQYNDWATARRERLHGKYHLCLHRLATLYLEQGRVTEVVEKLHPHVLAHPTDVDALCIMLPLLAQQGRYEEALQLAAMCQHTLQDEGQKPSVAITSIERRLHKEQEAALTQLSQSTFTTFMVPSDQRIETSTRFSHTIAQDIMETVRALEGTADLKSSDMVKRRAVIAHLLGIPPALFASDGHAIDNLAEAMKFQEETMSSLYEDMLIMGWDSFRRSKSPQIITRIDEHVGKLTTLTRSASLGDAEQWQSLLCRFSQLSTRIAQHRMDEQRALHMAKQAIMIAIDLDDTELIASTFYGRGRVHMEYSNTTTDEELKRRHFELAKADIDAALGHVERVRIPLAGNIYLLAAEIYALVAGNDMVLRTQCERWQDKVAFFVDNEKIEDDGTFLKLNPTALHHERAKTLLRFGKIEEARRELNDAWKTLQPNFFTWHMNMHLTQATLFLAGRDIEESAKSSLRAYTLAKTIHSHKGEVEVQYLLEQLQQLDKAHSSVRDLTMTIGG